MTLASSRISLPVDLVSEIRAATAKWSPLGIARSPTRSQFAARSEDELLPGPTILDGQLPIAPIHGVDS